eukprot:INCI20259.1.p1 GENE.INCI20259.1~~INCI20259.1.p1  ORF type:complete len:488 (+),score=95.71 INCI20259.1:214-1677(+)
MKQSMALIAVAAGLMACAPACATIDPSGITVDEVQRLLHSWSLDRAFSKCFTEMQVNGHFLTILQDDHSNDPLERCPSATPIHWSMLHSLFDEWAATPTTIPDSAGVQQQVESGTGGSNTAADSPRRRLATKSVNHSGLNIRHDHALIQMGANGDVVLTRSGPSLLTIDADVNITGQVMAFGYNGGHVQCAGIDLSDVIGRYNGTHSVSNGDFVDRSSILCDEGFGIADKVRWECAEDGSIATPSGDLCNAYRCSGVDVSSAVLHGGSYAGPTSVSTGELLQDVGAIGNCSGVDANDHEGVSMFYVPHENATWVCPEDGGIAVPSEQLCVCAESVCSDWVLLLSGASYGGSWDDEYSPLATGSFSQMIAVWKSGYVSCDNDYDASGKAAYPWNACGVSHSSCSGVDIYSWELKINDEYLLSQTTWCALPSGCDVPDTSTGDIACTIDFTLEEGDVLTPTWYEASRSVSTGDNSGTIYIDLYGYPASS